MLLSIFDDQKLICDFS